MMGQNCIHNFTHSRLIGGFGVCGAAHTLLGGILHSGKRNFHVFSNNAGTDTEGCGVLLLKDQVRIFTGSYFGGNKILEKKYLAGEIEVYLTPQGSFMEKIRSGGAGIAAFYTPSGIGTQFEEGGFPILYGKDGSILKVLPPKETRVFDGKRYVLEEAITGDYAIIKAQKCDKFGNLQFRMTAMNINPEMATAAKICIAEAEEMVESLDPDQIHLPGIYVDRLLLTDPYAHPIEKFHNIKEEKDGEIREKIARRAAKEIKDGMNVNLGIGIPSAITDYVDDDIQVLFQSENGLLGMGHYPDPKNADPDCIAASKEPISYVPGASIVSSVGSFAMIRGQHLDLTFLGAIQVSEQGDLANWCIPGKMIKGVGGAIDLSASIPVIVTMEHNNFRGEPKILSQCTIPLTGKKCVSKIITELGVFVPTDHGLECVEILDGHTFEQVQARTGCKLINKTK